MKRFSSGLRRVASSGDASVDDDNDDDDLDDVEDGFVDVAEEGGASPADFSWLLPWLWTFSTAPTSLVAPEEEEEEEEEEERNETGVGWLLGSPSVA
jgi:hypothetical protein